MDIWVVSNLGYYELFCYEYLCSKLRVYICFYLETVNTGSHDNSRLSLVKYHCFSPVAAPFYIPNSSLWEFQFLHILTDTQYPSFVL